MLDILTSRGYTNAMPQSVDIEVHYAGRGFPASDLALVVNRTPMAPTPTNETVELRHVLSDDDDPDAMPYRFGFTEDWSIALYTGPEPLPESVLAELVPNLRRQAHQRSHG